jgi:hypothetical protein
MANQIHEPINTERHVAAETFLATEDQHAQLFAGEDLDQFRDRWRQIQTEFVDDPRQSVHKADALVNTVIERLTRIFAEERAGLEVTLDDTRDPSTEDLRQALRRYRSFFDRLLTI